MNTTDPRRRALLKTAISLGLLSCSWRAIGNLVPYADVGLTEEMREFTAGLADTIIPPSDSPSASAADADAFALDVIFFAMENSFSTIALSSIGLLDKSFMRKYKQGFIAASIDSREQFLIEILQNSSHPAHLFVLKFRRFVMVGWVLNEYVAHKYLNYTHTLGFYDPSSKNNKEHLFSNLDRLYV
jgi:hypothetical protein